MTVIRNYGEFNFRRYSNPWVAIVNPVNGKPDFSKKVGGYTGGYNKGEAGSLYVTDPKENSVYMFGQKDYRGNNTEREYTIFRNGKFEEVKATELIDVLNGIK